MVTLKKLILASFQLFLDQIYVLPQLHSWFQRINGCLPVPKIVQDSKVGGAVHHAHAVLKVKQICKF